jgi:WD40 repeat protein
MINPKQIILVCAILFFTVGIYSTFASTSLDIPITNENADQLVELGTIDTNPQDTTTNFNIVGLTVSASGNLVATKHQDTDPNRPRHTIVQVWDIDTSGLIFQSEYEDTFPDQVLFADGESKLVIETDNFIAIIDIISGEQVDVLETGNNIAWRVKTDNAGALLAHRNTLNQLVLWSFEERRHIWASDDLTVQSVSFSYDDTRMLIINERKEFSFLDLSDLSRVEAFTYQATSVVISSYFSRTGNSLLINHGLEATAVSVETGQEVLIPNLASNAPVLFFRDYGQIVVVEQVGTSTFYDIENDRYLADTIVNERLFALNTNENLAAFYNWQGYIVIRDVIDGDEVKQISSSETAPYSIMFSADDSLVVIASGDGILGLWSLPE